MGVSSRPAEKGKLRNVHINNEDIYWELVDCDDDYDDFLHIISTYDGSEAKIQLKGIVKSMGFWNVVKALFL